MKPGAPAPPALGIDLGGSKIEARLFDDARRELWRERIATPQGDYGTTLAAITGLVGRAREQTPGAAPTIGIGTPGSAGALGCIKNANTTCLNGPRLTDLVHFEAAEVNGIEIRVQGRGGNPAQPLRQGPAGIGDAAKRGLTSLKSSLPEGSRLKLALTKLVERG